MITVSDAWKEVHKQFLLPEMFVEVSCEVTDVDAQDTAEITGTNESVISQISYIREDQKNSLINIPAYKAASLERNFWVLDGSYYTHYEDIYAWEHNYANDCGLEGSVTFTTTDARTMVIPGLTITWSTLYDAYPTNFSVIAKRGDTVVGRVTVSNNKSTTSIVEHEFTSYDSITVVANDWCLPDNRVRIERVLLGHILTFSKDDLISYSHEQQGDLNSAEIPKKHIEFSLNNVDGRWNPSNPVGLEKYLSERQRVTVRYGMMVNSAIEWINAGTFYLSEWRAPSNGLEASFVARDVFEYLLNTPYTGITTGRLDELVTAAMDCGGVAGITFWPNNTPMIRHTATIDGEYTCAEVIQMCANAGGCVIVPSRERRIDNGGIDVIVLDRKTKDYTISRFLSYSYPEITLSKPLKNVSVTYGDNQTCLLSVGTSGETQTVNNPLVSTEEQAYLLAEGVRNTLELRKTVSGEFRADPRLELYDVVRVESKYGAVPVTITNVKYTFSGGFHGSFVGKVISGTSAGSSALGAFILGESALGQEV